MLEFKLTNQETDQFMKWSHDHDDVCPLVRCGGIDFRHSFTFVPGRNGECVKVVRCACGEKLVLASRPE